MHDHRALLFVQELFAQRLLYAPTLAAPVTRRPAPRGRHNPAIKARGDRP